MEVGRLENKQKVMEEALKIRLESGKFGLCSKGEDRSLEEGCKAGGKAVALGGRREKAEGKTRDSG